VKINYKASNPTTDKGHTLLDKSDGVCLSFLYVNFNGKCKKGIFKLYLYVKFDRGRDRQGVV